MSVTRLSSYFSFKAKSYFWVSSSLLLKFLQFLLVILVLFLVFPLFSFIGILLKVALLVSFSTSSFCCREQSFLFLSLFFLYSCSFHFLYLFYLFSPSFSTSTFTSFFFAILLLLRPTLSQPFLDPLLLLSLPFLLFSSNQTHFFYF